MEKRFNIRVYGLAYDNEKLLVSDEEYHGRAFTKFPGGGLEFGEGTTDCLKREMQEEFGMEIKVVNHVYTTDFFQPSAFNKNDQLISIYYRIELLDRIEHAAETVPQAGVSSKLRWLKWSEITEEVLTFPVDKRVLKQIKPTT